MLNTAHVSFFPSSILWWLTPEAPRLIMASLYCFSPASSPSSPSSPGPSFRAICTESLPASLPVFPYIVPPPLSHSCWLTLEKATALWSFSLPVHSRALEVMKTNVMWPRLRVCEAWGSETSICNGNWRERRCKLSESENHSDWLPSKPCWSGFVLITRSLLWITGTWWGFWRQRDWIDLKLFQLN